MPADVSVVVPFFNPGANIDACLASLCGQTLPAEQLEVILVDDGSTDGSGARAAGWAERHPELFTVIRIEASGGPARPRNVGIERATGRYIQFLDSDDMLPPRSLQRQLQLADESDADVVVGKLASDFRGIWHPLFRETVTGKTLATYPLIQNLTVCKMFRREFLLEHQIRFPEGPHYIEDQQICVQAYAHARSVAVVADTLCYLYRRRRVGGRNFGDTTIDPRHYFRELAAIFDVIDTEVEPAARDASYARYYRGEMLGRLRGAAMLGYAPDYRAEMFAEVRDLARDRISEAVREALPVFPRIQSQLLLDDDQAGMLAFAGWLEQLRLFATATVAGWDDGRLLIDLDAHIRHGDRPLVLERDGDDWSLPVDAAPGVPQALRRLGGLDAADIDLATVSRLDASLWSTTAGLAMAVAGDGVPRVQCRVELDPSTVMGGDRLTAGLWDLRLRVMVGGLTRTSPLRSEADHPLPPAAWLTGPAGGGRAGRAGPVQAYWTDPTATLALDVDEWMHPLQARVAAAGAQLEGRRRLVVPAEQLDGSLDAARPATLLLEPLPAPGAATAPAVVGCAAQVRATSGQRAIVATIPRLPKHAGNWGVWLRFGPPGAAPATRLELDLTPHRLGRIAIAESQASPV